MNKLAQFIKMVSVNTKNTVSDQNGDISSKRVFALACFIVATIGFFQGKAAPELSVFMGAAAAVFIGQAISKT
jgi:hypothetical protein